jgi:hypothetical protein
LQRKEAVSLLKQLIERELVQPSFVSLEKNKQGGFDLVLKVDCDLQPLKKFLSENNLAVREEKGYCAIYKP